MTIEIRLSVLITYQLTDIPDSVVAAIWIFFIVLEH
jgi:hypothetical protein